MEAERRAALRTQQVDPCPLGFFLGPAGASCTLDYVWHASGHWSSIKTLHL